MINVSNFVKKTSFTVFSTVGIAAVSMVDLSAKAIVVGGVNVDGIGILQPQHEDENFNGMLDLGEDTNINEMLDDDWNNPMFITGRGGNGIFNGVVSLELDSSVDGPDCTGSLISNHYILTAAHCITDYDSGNVNVNSGSAFFRTGAGDVLNNDIEIGLNRFIKHPNYNTITLENDIALLRLVTKAQENIDRYGIYREDDEIGQVFTKIGYGVTGTGAAGNQRDEGFDSKKRIGENRYEQIIDTHINFDFDDGSAANNKLGNTGEGNEEVNTAPGDSGGPGFIGNLIASVTSFGDDDTSSFGDIAYDTRVSLFQGFIDSHTALAIPISFSVDGGAFNPLRDGIIAPLPNPAEGLFPFNPPPDPNDVWALSPFLGGYATEGEVFQSSGAVLGLPPDGTNIDRMSSALGIGPCPAGGPPYVGPFEPNPGAPLPCPAPPGGPFGTFGLQPDDNMISLSYGMDSGSILQFSVDPLAIGIPGTDVFYESIVSPMPDGDPGNEAAGDIFKTPEFVAFGSYIPDHIAYNHILVPAVLLNELYRDESEMGLQAPSEEGLVEPEDDLDGFEEADTGDPFWGVDFDVDGIVDFEKFSFFSLDEVSPSIGGSFTSDDIFVTTDPGFDFDIYADGVLDIDLQLGDILDALALSDIGGFGFGASGNAPNGILNPGADEALFSLAELSPSLLDFGVSPGDVFYTDFLRPFNPLLRWTEGGSLYARHDEIGLEFDDELNALDIKPSAIPEPSSILGLLAIGGLGLMGLRKKR
ncbi:MAG: trypsin-like serine protease [Okeania sp. SIO3B5]|uniref:S1 family peptidase n=1 Tax=Okeania sp. SIO3B5 TaxID=2607811 RepID=UPI0014007E4E|nr:trypsin-like serine protease [Okeania sp. SIO3B5]NEO54802.1 trypsin-like serine protease [Okeania sp. SIO3B5]